MLIQTLKRVKMYKIFVPSSVCCGYNGDIINDEPEVLLHMDVVTTTDKAMEKLEIIKKQLQSYFFHPIQLEYFWIDLEAENKVIHDDEL